MQNDAVRASINLWPRVIDATKFILMHDLSMPFVNLTLHIFNTACCNRNRIKINKYRVWQVKLYSYLPFGVGIDYDVYFRVLPDFQWKWCWICSINNDVVNSIWIPIAICKGLNLVMFKMECQGCQLSQCILSTDNSDRISPNVKL